jgi:hypothetical protein
MTGFAFEFVYFVLNISQISILDLLVAFVTGNINVFSVKDKPGGVMIKLAGFPVVKAMTPVAISDPFHFKLAGMNIFVTNCAICR